MKARLMLFTLVLFAACSGNKLSPEEMIAGTNSKIWKATSEDSGNAAAVEQEANETMRFSSNGTFAMQSAAQTALGTWTYEEAGPTLRLVFDDEDYSQNFKITKLIDNEMHLEAADGSVMVLMEE